MTNRLLRRNILIPLVMLFLLCLSPISGGQAQSEEPIILFYQPNRDVVRIEFTGEDLARAQSDPRAVLRKLEERGVKLCTERKRISSCIWVCCQDKVRTCNKVLTTALEQLWGV